MLFLTRLRSFEVEYAVEYPAGITSPTPNSSSLDLSLLPINGSFWGGRLLSLYKACSPFCTGRCCWLCSLLQAQCWVRPHPLGEVGLLWETFALQKPPARENKQPTPPFSTGRSRLWRVACLKIMLYPAQLPQVCGFGKTFFNFHKRTSHAAAEARKLFC